MEKKISRGDPEFELFQDFWKFRQQTYEPSSDDEFEKAVKMAKEITDKYDNTSLKTFARQLIMLHLEDAEKRYKQKGVS